MMSKRKPQGHNEDRLKFLLALMTKDYENAMKLGSSVLRGNPNDLNVLKTLSAVKDKVAVNSLAESADDDLDEDIPDEENMQTHCDTSDPDSDTESDETEIDDRMTIDANKCRQCTLPPKNFSDRTKSRLFSRITKKDIKDYKFKEKIYRILPVKMNDEFTSRA